MDAGGGCTAGAAAGVCATIVERWKEKVIMMGRQR